MPDLPPPPGPEPTEHRKQRLLRLALLVIVVTFAGSRAVISLGAGHLLLHLDPAEYGLLRAVAEFSDSNTRELLADPDALRRFGTACLQVADTGFHLSLVLAGLLVHIATTEFGLPLGTLCDRVLAVSVSTGALLAWLLALRLALGRSAGRVQLGFALLWLVPVPMILKLSMTWWGTHDLVLGMQAVLMLALAPWLREETAFRAGLLRAPVVGLLGAAAMAANTSLVLPMSFVGLRIALGPLSALRRERAQAARRLLQVAGLVALGAGAFLVGGRLISGVELLSDLGLQAQLMDNDKLSLLSLADLGGVPSRWAEASRSSWPLWPAAAAAIWNLVAWLRRPDAPGVSKGGFVLFCSAYLLLGSLAVASMPFAFQEDVDFGGFLRFIPRYTAHLHPIGMVCLAGWAMDRDARGGRWRALGLAAWVLWCAPAQLALIDTGNLQAGLRYDGLRLHGQSTGLNADQHLVQRAAFQTASTAFLDGMLVMQAYQDERYWKWVPPSEVRGWNHGGFVGDHLDRRGGAWQGEDRAAFLAGIGYGMSIVISPAHRDLLDGIAADSEQERRWFEHGFALTLEDFVAVEGTQPAWRSGL